MIEIEKLRTQVSEVEQQFERSDGELADRARKIRECIEAVQEGLVAKTAELQRKAVLIGKLRSENEELRSLFSRLLGMLENRHRIDLDQELSDLGAKVDSLADLAKAEVTEVSVEVDAGTAGVKPPGARPKATLPPYKYDNEWLQKVRERVEHLTEDVEAAQNGPRPGVSTRWNEHAYGPPPGPAAKKAPGQSPSDKPKGKNAA